MIECLKELYHKYISTRGKVSVDNTPNESCEYSFDKEESPKDEAEYNNEITIVYLKGNLLIKIKADKTNELVTNVDGENLLFAENLSHGQRRGGCVDRNGNEKVTLINYDSIKVCELSTQGTSITFTPVEATAKRIETLTVRRAYKKGGLTITTDRKAPVTVNSIEQLSLTNATPGINSYSLKRITPSTLSRLKTTGDITYYVLPKIYEMISEVRVINKPDKIGPLFDKLYRKVILKLLDTDSDIFTNIETVELPRHPILKVSTEIISVRNFPTEEINRRLSLVSDEVHKTNMLIERLLSGDEEVTNDFCQDSKYTVGSIEVHQKYLSGYSILKDLEEFIFTQLNETGYRYNVKFMWGGFDLTMLVPFEVSKHKSADWELLHDIVCILKLLQEGDEDGDTSMADPYR